jgi:hypothetical protein
VTATQQQYSKEEFDRAVEISRGLKLGKNVPMQDMIWLASFHRDYPTTLAAVKKLLPRKN